ncbi:MAG: hypothetical protein M1831_001760 [Alyxoria varia]|nr:MAG: hypothetical protein M1831_001760 [Alyxoria varia]
MDFDLHHWTAPTSLFLDTSHAPEHPIRPIQAKSNQTTTNNSITINMQLTQSTLLLLTLGGTLVSAAAIPVVKRDDFADCMRQPGASDNECYSKTGGPAKVKRDDFADCMRQPGASDNECYSKTGGPAKVKRDDFADCMRQPGASDNECYSKTGGPAKVKRDGA